VVDVQPGLDELLGEPPAGADGDVALMGQTAGDDRYLVHGARLVVAGAAAYQVADPPLG
jgi:hypothetical protein